MSSTIFFRTIHELPQSFVRASTLRDYYISTLKNIANEFEFQVFESLFIMI